MYTYIKKLTKRDSIQVLLRQAQKCSISLVKQFNTIYDGKEPERRSVLQTNDYFGKNSGDLFDVPTRNWLPRKLLVHRFWIEFEKIKTQNINLICSRLLIVLLIVMILSDYVSFVMN